MQTANTPSAPTMQEARPFLHLAPRTAGPRPQPVDADGLALLERLVAPETAALVRSLVGYSLARSHRRGLESAENGALPISVLNRRRRAARAWIVAILGGRTDRATLHTLAHAWAPQLAGSGPELGACVASGRACVEFLRGAMTGLVFAEPADNLVPQARALHALETVLGMHLGAIVDAGRRAAAV
jgi:hypothetical protein